MLRKIDIYIIKKFLGTFFLSILIIISLAIIFDWSEKVNSFHDAPLRAIIFEHYINFIPFYANLFSPLFTLIAVLYFTSRLASHFEVVAMLSSGISFFRIMVPYLISGLIIGLLVFVMGNYIIPHGNKSRIKFEDTYVNYPYQNKEVDIHRQTNKDEYVYMESYNNQKYTGYKFALEKIQDNKLITKLIADSIKWDKDHKKWNIYSYYQRVVSDDTVIIHKGTQKDTVLNLTHKDLSRRTNFIAQTMDANELNTRIKLLNFRGEKTGLYRVEKYRRESLPFSILILTIIGMTIALRNLRGGVGAHIAYGILLSFIYIISIKISTTYAVEGALHPRISVWIPNIVFSFIAIFLYKTTPK